MTRNRLRFYGLAVAGLALMVGFGVLARADTSDGRSAASELGLFGGDEATPTGMKAELLTAALRLPIAAALGTLLALRPQRGGTPPRQRAVVQTQIILAIVGAVIMLVVGASLARAFGIVGVASLIRYRSKIEDPKDAVVMLAALAVGLAAGSGVLALAGFATAFTVAVLWIIEGFESQARIFELTVKLGEKTGTLRPGIESILRRVKARFELRSSSEEEVSYLVTAPQGLQTDLVSDRLTALAPGGKGGIEWKLKSKATP
ncbi:MAG TPA: DUF4956 domain-containing protein [Dongiaceae bacterium]|nr:DUF4956 domain-containing protein [Dongiaceae bacterium]